ncbi:type I-E CRISPR-associated protein Cas6/Cse3/CasE [Quadrisphaera sp. DSM 44207]|uniref:type I-E CRISPR-associated protein Cas6/Cse3/CasE n=1 Tax=Quadrisphaera sp. DSM 44207 TaxID=1881057 RepID=UPI00087E36EB|nr:type I-E CRISPR-associated protein Cas6/Cse3/CasE [Quadrisphaera sp. DSM 44207]SDQ03917.1 CRISPR-associated protein, Cse3 family [Quadrisphaera sp. DSM 44207]
MTTLIQLTLNPRHRAVQHDLADAHALHQRVMSLLPDGLGPDPRASTRTLFRIEDTSTGPRLLIQTGGEAIYERLPDGYCSSVRSLSMTQFFAALTLGRLVRYSLTASPAKRAAVGELKGKRVALIAYNDVHAWWQRKATAAGLDLTGQLVQITPAPGIDGARPQAPRGQRITHRAQRIEGLAIVQDLDLLLTAVRTGIGPGKAYGLGLLSVIPVGTP